MIKSGEPVGRSVRTDVLSGVIESGTDEKSDECAMGVVRTSCYRAFPRISYHPVSSL
jgi:hypothetical protein